MKNRILLFIILCISLNINNIYTNTIQLELIKQIDANYLPEGKYDKERITMAYGPPAGPSCFIIYNNLIYIPDDWKNRFIVYDLNINFIKEITIKTEGVGILGAQRIELLKDKILIISNSVTSINMDGYVYYKNKYNVKDEKDFFIIADNLYYYTKENTFEGVAEDGNKINEKEAISRLQDNNGWQKGIFNKYEKINIEIINFLNKNHLLFFNNKLFYWQFDKYHKEYFNILKKANLNHTNLDPKYLLQLIDFDSNNNSYWKVLDRNFFAPKHLCILNSRGEIIQWANDILFGSMVQVNNNGDIYLIYSKRSKKTYSFYRIPNTWDPITTDDQLQTPTLPTITSFPKATWLAYDKDWYMYHPSRMFDGKLASGWLDGSKDSGIGDTISLELESEITVNEIKVAPGYFDERWWADNNRIKKLNIKAGDKSVTASFKDVMKMQSVKLKEQLTFKEIAFTVEQVYKSPKSDDTAISEIEFYNKGEKIELDLSTVGKYMKKVTREEAEKN